MVEIIKRLKINIFKALSKTHLEHEDIKHGIRFYVEQVGYIRIIIEDHSPNLELVKDD